ncbi:MAG: MarC family protein [Candidatus Bostrichicola ureolyticus]|nr:MAG: MarC family protein [Candidatus Bostrichicola ureolyticus]
MEVIKSFIACFMILFSIIDIVGNAPIIMSFKSSGNIINTKKVIFVSFCIFLSFLLFGNNILTIIGIDVCSFSVAGSIVLFFIAVEMILGIELHKITKSSQISIVPIAFPLIAGPGSITTLISLRNIYDIKIILISLLLNIIIVYLVLEQSDFIEKKIGESGLDLLKRIFGIILLAFSLKLFGDNICELIKHKIV